MAAEKRGITYWKDVILRPGTADHLVYRSETHVVHVGSLGSHGQFILAGNRRDELGVEFFGQPVQFSYQGIYSVYVKDKTCHIWPFSDKGENMAKFEFDTEQEALACKKAFVAWCKQVNLFCYSS